MRAKAVRQLRQREQAYRVAVQAQAGIQTSRSANTFRAIAPRPWLRLAIPLILLACLLPFYWTSFHAPAVGTIHDDGIYLVTAKAMAEGQGYRIASLPDAPRQTKYPIGFPALLALAWKAFPKFPENVPLLKLVPVLSFLAWIGLCGFLARRWGHANWEATLWIAFFCAGTRWAIFAGTNLMSDLLFGALVLASLHFLLSVEESERPVRAALAAGLLCALAYTVRTSALALVASGILALVLRQRRRPALAFAAVSLCVVAAWMLWQGGGPVYSNPISAYYTAQNYADWNLLTGPYQRAEKLAVLVTNLSYLLTYPAQIVISKKVNTRTLRERHLPRCAISLNVRTS